MRNIGTNQPRATRRWIRSQISTHITGRQVQRAQTGNLQVCEVLAYAPPLPKNESKVMKYLPLIIGLNALFLIALLLIVIFALKK